MLSFEGKYKSKKKGKSYANNISSDDVIANSRELRKERQNQRREEESSLLIQRVYRGYHIRQIIKKLFLKEFMEKLNSSFLTDISLHRLVLLFIFIFRKTDLDNDLITKMVKLFSEKSLPNDSPQNIQLLEIFSNYLARLPPKSPSNKFTLVLNYIIKNLKLWGKLSHFESLSRLNYFRNISAFLRNQNQAEFLSDNQISLEGMDRISRERFLAMMEPLSVFLDQLQKLESNKKSLVLVSFLNSLTSHERANKKISLILISQLFKVFNDPQVVVDAMNSDSLQVKPNLVYVWLRQDDISTLGPKYAKITENLISRLINLQNIKVDYSKQQVVHLGAGHLTPFCQFEVISLHHASHVDHDPSYVRLYDESHISPSYQLDGYSFDWLELFSMLKERLKTYLSSFMTSDGPPNPLLEMTVIRSICRLYYILRYVYREMSFDEVLKFNARLSSHSAHVMQFYRCLLGLTVTVELNNSEQTTVMSIIEAIRENGFPRGTKASEIDDFFAVCTTFCASLRHYLLRMSDEELVDSKASDGIHPHNLISMNNFFLDIILGIINLSHPLNDIDYDLLRLPLNSTPRTEEVKYQMGIYVDEIHHLINVEAFNLNSLSGDQSVNGIMLSHSQRLDDQIFKQIMHKVNERHNKGDGTEPMETNEDMDESEEGDGHQEERMSHYLHTIYRYRECFQTLQRLVSQIYLWHKRSEQLLSSPEDTGNLNSQDDSNKKIPGPTIWERDNIVDLILSHPERIISWVSNNTESSSDQPQDNNPLVILAKSPFGYFSKYNTEGMNYGLSCEMIRLIRQMIILLHLPFTVKFSVRNQILRALVLNKADTRVSFDPFSLPEDRSHLSIRIRRTHIYEDAFESLNKLNAPSIRPQLKVTFINEHRVEEIGYDGGGLSREFISDLITTAFDPIRGLFLLTDSKDFPALYPNPAASEIYPNYKEHYFFLGRILGKALAMGMLLEIRFAVFFLAKIVSKSSRSIIDFVYLKTLDQDLYKNLKFIKNYDKDVTEIGLDFTLNEKLFSDVKTIELVPSGSSIKVTNENRLEYIHKVTNHKLNLMIKTQTDEFIRGLADVICIDWLRIYDCFELQTLISGSQSNIDIADLKRNTEYSKRAHVDSATINHLWSILESFEQTELRSLLRFVTGCSSPPMFGFENLHPPFTIHLVPEVDRLPTASTCVNMLKIPDYKDIDMLRKKLLYAINSKAGFDYS